VLSERLGGWTMRGYSKVDDNTFPNIMAMLSGYKVCSPISARCMSR
jgi:hypothetical protein